MCSRSAHSLTAGCHSVGRRYTGETSLADLLLPLSTQDAWLRDSDNPTFISQIRGPPVTASTQRR